MDIAEDVCVVICEAVVAQGNAMKISEQATPRELFWLVRSRPLFFLESAQYESHQDRSLFRRTGCIQRRDANRNVFIRL
jgi:hypothetical protein